MYPRECQVVWCALHGMRCVGNGLLGSEPPIRIGASLHCTYAAEPVPFPLVGFGRLVLRLRERVRSTCLQGEAAQSMDCAGTRRYCPGARASVAAGHYPCMCCVAFPPVLWHASGIELSECAKHMGVT
jgi:hypothetical protein